MGVGTPSGCQPGPGAPFGVGHWGVGVIGGEVSFVWEHHEEGPLWGTASSGGKIRCEVSSSMGIIRGKSTNGGPRAPSEGQSPETSVGGMTTSMG